MINLPTCPFCNNDWNRDVSVNFLRCYKCDVYYWDNDLLSICNFICKKDELCWDFKNNNCDYSNKGGTFRNRIKLPLLPINITPQKLKLYILFS